MLLPKWTAAYVLHLSLFVTAVYPTVSLSLPADGYCYRMIADLGPVVAPVLVQADKADDLEQKIRHYLDHNIRTSRYSVFRGTFDYLTDLKTPYHPPSPWGSQWSDSLGTPAEFPFSLGKSLAKLNGKSHVVDLGAGVFIFISEYLDNLESLRKMCHYYGEENMGMGPAVWEPLLVPENRPNFTGVTTDDFTRVHGSRLRGKLVFPSLQDLAANPKINALVGRFFESLSKEDLISKFGNADLVIDHFGVFAYTLNLGRVIFQVAEIMNPGSEFWFQHSFQKIHFPDGKSMTVPEFLIHTGLFESPSINFLESVGDAIPIFPTLLVRTKMAAFSPSLYLNDLRAQEKGDLPHVDWLFGEDQ